MIQSDRRAHEARDAGADLHRLVAALYPYCRSTTGNGVRATLRHLQDYIPLAMHEVPSGTKVLDWTVPREWNIKDAYVKDSHGRRVIDFQRSNLHVAGYSIPVSATMSLTELRRHLITLPDRPEWIPFRTLQAKDDWAFCLSHRDLLALEDGPYEVCIDATLEPGALTYGEYVLPGLTSDEVLVSTHVCHPSLCNDNLSGIAVATYLARALAGRSRRRFSYRFVFVPATIGSIAWLAANEATLGRIKHGLVIANAGDAGRPTYKRSRRGAAEVDRAVAHVLRSSGRDHEVQDFVPYGYDERQYCSPGFDLPVGCFSRTPHGRFPEYHTSADNLEFVRPESLAESYSTCLAVFDVLEGNGVYVNQNPRGEPHLGSRGLYRGYPHTDADDLALLWVLNLSDGRHSLLDIAERSGNGFATIKRAADRLLATGLLVEAGA
jgi:aminopeptidase-like protein